MNEPNPITINKPAGLAMAEGARFCDWRHQHTNYDKVVKGLGFNSEAYKLAVYHLASDALESVYFENQKHSIIRWAESKLVH